MLLKFLGKKGQDVMGKCSSRFAFVFFVLVSSASLSGCENSETGAAIKEVESTKLSAVTEVIHSEETTVFAPTKEKERKGMWRGGPPPINKRASGIDTYYRIKSAGKPNHLKMTLRFEGATFDDARVAFRAIDGAKLDPLGQRTQWRLKPNVASEVSFTVVVPDNVSYLTLDTFQNNKGSSRAFILIVSARHK